MNATTELNEMAENFFASTKRFLTSCKCAYANIENGKLIRVWGDFGRRSDAVEAMKMWGMAFRTSPEWEMNGRNYRISCSINR